MAVKQYDPIDIHKPVAPLWPDPLPPLTAHEAERAARRLWRYAMGETYTGKVHIGSGNRYNWYRNGVLTVNPSRGWKNLIHELSHYFWYDANPGERPHSKHHARFEIKLTKEALRRGWLDGKLKAPGRSLPRWRTHGSASSPWWRPGSSGGRPKPSAPRRPWPSLRGSAATT
jgi:hypothetical protein